MFVGLTISVMPHIAVYMKTGSIHFLTDNDDIIYLAVSRAPYHGEFGPRDPFLPRQDRIPTVFPWLFVVPWAKLTAAVGLRFIHSSLVWRVVGGLLMGFSLYVLFAALLAPLSRPIPWATVCALICMGDSGIDGRGFIQNFLLIHHFWQGTTPITMARGMALFRVISPLLILPWLFLLLAALVPRPRWSWKKLAAGAILMGICIKIFFFAWTAMFLAAGLWVLFSLFRRSRWIGESESTSNNWPGVKGLTLVLAGGLLIGGPQLLDNTRTFNNPQFKPSLERTARGVPLEKGHPARYYYIMNKWTLAKLAIGAAVILGMRWFEYSFIWFLTLAGYLLNNSALITGLEFENFHWSLIHAVIGEILILTLVCRLIDARVGWRKAFAIPAIAFCLFAASWRAFEPLHAPETVRYSGILRELASLESHLAKIGPEDVLAGVLPETNVALLFTQGGQLFQHPYVAHHSLVDDREVHERNALNAWLLGRDRDGYLREAREEEFAPIPVSSRPEWFPESVLERRRAIFERLHAGESKALLKRYHPNFLLQPANAPRPSRGGTWTKVATSGKWSLWKLENPPDADLADDASGR